MTGRRRIRFVETAADAPPPEPGIEVVVLDTAWTPRPVARTDVRPVRAAMTAVLRRHELFDESLERLDNWAHRAGVDDILLVEGIAWWYRIRPFAWYALHECMLWRFVVAELERDGLVSAYTLPAGRESLAAAVRAVAARTGAAVTVADAVAGLATTGPTVHGSAAGGLLDWGRRIARRLLRWAGRRPVGARTRRRALLDARADAIARRPAAVLAVAQHHLFQVVNRDDAGQLVEPLLAPVLDRLGSRGVESVSVGLGLDHRRDEDWTVIEADPSLLPVSYARVRWGRPEDADVDASATARQVAAIDVPLDVEGANLGPAMAQIVRWYAGDWLDGQLRALRVAQRLVDELRPGVLFLTGEGIRTEWLAAARRRGVPIVSIQHGIIYPTHPVYRHLRLPSIILPDWLCVYGTWERDVLLRDGAYLPDEVPVTGSPRLGWDAGAAGDPATLAAERAAVRRELGVADGDRLLVVSTAHVTIVRDVHVVDMLARLLGAPLNGIHVVFKQHPGEQDEGPYRALLRGLAAAGGHTPPAMTVVRDVDLYRLLRAADAHLGLHSTVLTDAVVTGTPNLIAAGQAYGDLLGYVAAGVARPVDSPAAVVAALADPRPPDPSARAAFLAAHFAEGDACGRVVAVIERALGTMAR